MPPEILKKALAHLKKDTRLRELIEKYPKPEIGRGGSVFEALCRAIIFQQLSGKAARTIHERFLKLFPKNTPTPHLVLKRHRDSLREAGLSNQKTDYLYDLARHFAEGLIEPTQFGELSDEEIRRELVAVKGIGIWTADMFLMFTLGRPNVLPTLDLGIKKGFQRLFKLRSLPDEKKMQKLAQDWHPYCTVAAWYLWRLADEGNPNRPTK